MATVTTNEVGVVIELEHSEIDTITKGAAGIAGGAGAVLTPVLVAFGVAAPIIGAIVAIVAAYFVAQAWLISQVDKGNGVYLTIPWPALFLGQHWLIIPTTRPPVVPLPQLRWSDVDHGEFGTNDPADSIGYQIDHNAVAADQVFFRLAVGQNTSGWAKVIIMPDGQGNQWEIRAQGRGGSAENSLWANQVRNGQVLTFRKPKMFGVWNDVLNLGQLDGLHGGDRVTFTWNRD